MNLFDSPQLADELRASLDDLESAHYDGNGNNYHRVLGALEAIVQMYGTREMLAAINRAVIHEKDLQIRLTAS